MQKPKMIIFDYGQTLVHEEKFNGVAGIKAVLDKGVLNPNNITAEEVQNFARALNRDIGRYNPETGHLYIIEVHNHAFLNYLYEYFGLTRIVSPVELERIFWDAASPGSPTKNIAKLLAYLQENDIRSAVISNLSFSGQALKNRINALIPQNNFEFIMASSEYVFRKPHRRIFELAVKKAKLEANEIWYCGDNGSCDVEGAEMAGLFPVWYNGAYQGDDYTPKKECLVISDWLELIAVLEGSMIR